MGRRLGMVFGTEKVGDISESDIDTMFGKLVICP